MAVSIPQGYKQTEVGVIPEDWGVLRLGDLAKFRTGPFGSALHKSDYTSNGIPVINPMHIIDGKIIPSQSMTITESAAFNLSDFRLKSEDIIIGRRGDMGRCGVIYPHQTGWLCGTGSMIIHTKKALNPFFLQRVLSSPRVVSAIEDLSVGTTMVNLNQSILSSLKIQVPSLAEQTAIANALSDADAWIQSLTRLIAKKRQIKQGAMQRLLNPYENGVLKEGWVVKKLGDISPLQRGFDLPNSELEQGKYPVVYSNGIANYHIAKQVTGPGVITGRSGTIGNIHFVTTDYWPHNTTLWVTNFNGNIPKFIFYLFDSIGFSRFATGSGVPTLNRNDAHSFFVGIPESPEEQTRIATILSDMDREITQLETKLTKAKTLKQGMMQNLLTGKIRLVELQESADAIA